MFTYHPIAARVLVDDRRRDLATAANARYDRQQARRHRRLRVDR